MIVVEANLVSAISPGRDANLCRVEIANVRTNDTGSRADYEVRLYARASTGSNGIGRLVRTARVENWPRNAKPAWRLIQAAFEALGA